MIKGLIMDIGDIIYDCKLYKKTSPLLMKLRLEQPVLVASMFLVRIYSKTLGKLYKPKFTSKRAEMTRERFKLRTNVADTLQKLHDSKVKIVLLSDSVRSSQTLFERMVDLGIADYIDGVISSAEIMAYKPQAEAYRKALDFIGLSKKEAVFVGHARDELVGAQKFGIRTIGYNMDEEIDVNYKINDFSEILKVVGEDNAKGSDLRS